MFKKILFFLFVIVLVGCSTSQPVVRTSKTVYKKPTSKVTTTPSKKPVGNRTAVTSSNKKPVTQPVVVAKKASTAATSVEKKAIEENYESAKEKDKSTKNQTVYSKTEILEATTRVKVTTAMVLDYISTYKEVAKNNMRQYGIPSSIILGQGILESGAGTGPLSILANNHFGIKCHKDWIGPSVNYDDDEEQECFRKYDKSMESYQDHSLFLLNRPWYKPLFDLEKDDYKLWARGLKNAGYATDPKYPDKLIAIIERYQLNQYDAEVLGKDFVLQVSNVKPLPFNAELYEVLPGDTLYSISKKFNISVDDLKRYNDIQDNALSIGQNLKVK
ncbi:MAG: glucosaminidase domain-containing protein [Flavobacterium sp.]|nr:glucosaminidase domain-containing protein [Flavobacterium sp.]